MASEIGPSADSNAGVDSEVEQRRKRQKERWERERREAVKLACSVLAFCASHGITKPTYYKLKREGLGPQEMRIARRVLISHESAVAWRAMMTARTIATTKTNPNPENAGEVRPGD
jgi:hypothetical protein